MYSLAINHANHLLLTDKQLNYLYTNTRYTPLYISVPSKNNRMLYALMKSILFDSAEESSCINAVTLSENNRSFCYEGKDRCIRLSPALAW